MQAARGTAVAGGSRLVLLLVVAGAVFALDLVSKLVAVRQLADREPVELLGGLLTLRLVRNPGAAFGMAQGLTVVLTVIAVVVVVAILRTARRLTSPAWAVALGMVLGGALGNLADRLFRAPGPGRGHVVDFLELPRWPVFNLADSAIVLAAAVMVILSLRGVPHAATGERQGGEAPTGAGPPEKEENSR